MGCGGSAAVKDRRGKGKKKKRVGGVVVRGGDDEPEAPGDDDTPQYISWRDYFGAVADATVYEYHFIREIGRGSFGAVWEAQTTDEHFAVKCYENTVLTRPVKGGERLLDAVDREVALMDELRHRYILSFYERICHPKSDSTYIVMPFADGSLERDRAKMKPDDVAVAFFQVAEGMRHAHASGIVHRDLKPENILRLAPRHYLVADWGSACHVKDGAPLSDTAGTAAFMSEEALSGDPYLPMPVDVWAYGVSLYQCVFGVLPFRIGEESDFANAMLHVSMRLEEIRELTMPDLPKGFDGKVVAVIEGALARDPARRLTFAQIIKMPFFAPALPIDAALVREEEEAAAG